MKFFFTVLVRLFSFVGSRDLLFVDETSEKVKVCKLRRKNKILKIKEDFKNSLHLNSKCIVLSFLTEGKKTLFYFSIDKTF